MRIGKLELATGAALAPMAGISDVPMRALCASFGALFTVSEMVSAKALIMKDKKSRQLLRSGGGSAPFGVQLFGQEPDVMAEAIKCIENESYDFLDLNMGCPAQKIVGHGAGSGLLKNPALAGEIAKATVKASSRPVSAKLRIGWDDDTMTGLEVAVRCEDAGIAFLTIHGRTRVQQYMPGVRYEEVARIKQAVKIPVLFNGDVTGGPSALAAIEKTGCDGVMVGRGAIGNPWVFREVKAALLGEAAPPTPGFLERMRVMEEQVRAMCEDKGEERAMREARKVAAGYLRGLRGAAALRHEAYALTHFNDLLALVQLATDYQENRRAEDE